MMLQQELRVCVCSCAHMHGYAHVTSVRTCSSEDNLQGFFSHSTVLSWRSNSGHKVCAVSLPADPSYGLHKEQVLSSKAPWLWRDWSDTHARTAIMETVVSLCASMLPTECSTDVLVYLQYGEAHLPASRNAFWLEFR